MNKLSLLIIGILTIFLVGSSSLFIGEKAVGIIEGSLSYPSDYIPKELAVCAENISTQEVYCVNNRIYDDKYEYGIGYKMEVPVGNYYVYSTLEKDYPYLTDESLNKGYYTNYVVCTRLGYEKCQSHDPVEVPVFANQVIENIDPYY